MIPIKLTMRDFMCYRGSVPPLHFEGIHLVCLSGDNGNGKSALIDAMTWALWGQARAKSDDDLIYSGQAEMEVEFDFAVGQQTYRIIRKRSKPKRPKSTGQSILEFQQATGDGFKAITGNSIAQTQQKITDVLHMNYDTFVNSSYLRQGRADEFTIKQPATRKEVLAYILGLSFYDELEQRAREMAKHQAEEKTPLESNIKEISDELAQKPIYEAELEQAQTDLSRMEKTIKGREAELNRIRSEKESLEQKNVQLNQLEAHIRDTGADLARWNEQVEQHHTRLNEYEGVIAQRPAIEEGYARFAETRRISDDLDDKFRQSVNLERQKAQLDARIKEAGHGLNTEHALVQSDISKLAARLQSLPDLKNQRHQIQVQSRLLGEQEEILDKKKQSSHELLSQVNYLESNKSQWEREIKEIREKLDLLSSQTEANCPLCETELSAEGLELIRSKYTVDEHIKSESLKTTQSELAQKKAGLESLQNEITQLESRLNQGKSTIQSKLSVLDKEIAEAEDAELQLSEEGEKLAKIEQRLASKDFAAIEQEALRELETESANLGYDAEQHKQVRLSLGGLEQYDRSRHKLEEADRFIDREKEAVARAEEATQKLSNTLETDTRKKGELTEELASLPQLQNDLTRAETEHQALAAQQTYAQKMVWSVKTKLERCAELEIKKKEKEKQLTRAAKQEDIYKELAKAFGKGGIQALLIEMALPEIEDETNRLLSRMTDNRMHVKFETQRETKKGNVIETLDINISDELGTRNYEMFSGGEAFRINFAIRIALSKLLSKRAGAPLPTLIIDEGFGTQDSTGLEKVKEAINSIQDDFEKIIVITHIEEFRDAFPTRIDVVKTAEGSTLSVN